MFSTIQTKAKEIHRKFIYCDYSGANSQDVFTEALPDDSCKKRLDSYEKGIQALLENFEHRGFSSKTIQSLKPKISAAFNKAQTQIEQLAKAKIYSVSKYKKIIQYFLLEVQKTLEKETKIKDISALIRHFERLIVEKQEISGVHTLMHFKETHPNSVDAKETIYLSADKLDQKNIGLNKEWKRIKAAHPPKWFQTLPFLVQKEYQHRGEKETLASDSISSSARDIPGLANGRYHRVEVATEGNKTVLLESMSHAILSPIHVRHAPSQLWLTLLNLSQVIQLAIQAKSSTISVETPLPILLQTLVSPGPITALLNEETRYYHMKQKAIACFEYALLHPDESIKDEFLTAQVKAHGAQNSPITYHDLLSSLGFHLEKAGVLIFEEKPFKIELISSNYPVNSLGRLNRLLYKLWPFSKESHKVENKKGQARLVQSVQKFLEKNPNAQDFKRISEYLKAYEIALKHPIYKGRRKSLYLASLEEILVYAIGGVPSGSCKSGKDRYGVKTMHSQAMVLYSHRYGKVLYYHATEEERAQFNEILSALYLSGHHQTSAELNAPGALGIKNPVDFLPKDTCRRIQALEPNRLSQDHQLAGLNKLHAPPLWKQIWRKIEPIVRKLFSTKSTSQEAFSPFTSSTTEVYSKSLLNTARLPKDIKVSEASENHTNPVTQRLDAELSNEKRVESGLSSRP